MKKANGTTMVELLLYMGIFSMLLIIFLQIFSMTLDSQTESKSTSSIAQDSKFIISRLSYDLSLAQTINSPNLGSWGSTLQFTKNSVTYTYTLTNGNLTLTDNIETDRLNSLNTTVSNTSFKRLGNSNGKNNIQAQFTLTSIALCTSSPRTETFQATVGQR